MKYRTDFLFPVRFFTFTAPEELTADTLEKLQHIEYRSYNEPYGVGTSDQLHSRPEFRELHEWFQKCVDTLHRENGWHCDRLVVNKSWANRSDAGSGDHHSPHRHPMSFLSGIFYLTQGPPTVFLDPLRDREWGQFHLDGGPHSETRCFIHPGPGGLVLFPSYMVHGSVENESDIDRFTIALNTFPSGEINLGAFDRPMAEVSVNGWAELGPLSLSDDT
tara:strand:- start:1402 stop:2058 length:657 start_codon:yes stop_codon:yes gene_type:complete